MWEAVGVVETRGLVGAIEAADAMAKAAKVAISDFRVVGSGLVAVTVSGDVAAVQAAVDAGHERAAQISEVVSYNVIPRPHSEVSKLRE
jgi:microcompartment protein CcmL/EutN